MQKDLECSSHSFKRDLLWMSMENYGGIYIYILYIFIGGCVTISYYFVGKQQNLCPGRYDPPLKTNITWCHRMSFEYWCLVGSDCFFRFPLKMGPTFRGRSVHVVEPSCGETNEVFAEGEASTYGVNLWMGAWCPPGIASWQDVGKHTKVIAN